MSGNPITIQQMVNNGKTSLPEYSFLIFPLFLQLGKHLLKSIPHPRIFCTDITQACTNHHVFIVRMCTIHMPTIFTIQNWLNSHTFQHKPSLSSIDQCNSALYQWLPMHIVLQLCPQTQSNGQFLPCTYLKLIQVSRIFVLLTSQMLFLSKHWKKNSLKKLKKENKKQHVKHNLIP